MVMAKAISVYLDVGPKWVFACALDWPGWCRRGRSEEEAIGSFLEYAPRYQAAIGRRVAGGVVEIAGRLDSGAIIDFGALGGPGPWDGEPWSRSEAQRQVSLLQASWDSFDRVAASAPEHLRKGPRGGGRDTPGIVDHVREGERSYAAKLGTRVPPRTPWPDQRRAISDALLDPDLPARWPPRYSVRRVAWHVLDHLWEIEDKTGT